MQVAPYNYLAVKPYGLHRRNQSIKHIQWIWTYMNQQLPITNIQNFGCHRLSLWRYGGIYHRPMGYVAHININFTNTSIIYVYIYNIWIHLKLRYVGFDVCPRHARIEQQWWSYEIDAPNQSHKKSLGAQANYLLMEERNSCSMVIITI